MPFVVCLFFVIFYVQCSNVDENISLVIWQRKHFQNRCTCAQVLNNKSVLSLVPRLSTWRYPQPQLGHLQLLIDIWYTAPVLLSIDVCCPRPGCSKRQMLIDGQTDRRTDTRPLHRLCTAYYADSVRNQVCCFSGTLQWYTMQIGGQIKQ